MVEFTSLDSYNCNREILRRNVLTWSSSHFIIVGFFYHFQVDVVVILEAGRCARVENVKEGFSDDNDDVTSGVASYVHKRQRLLLGVCQGSCK